MSESLDDIDRRLEAHETALAEYRQRQEANAADITALQGLTSELLDIARLHQQALRLSQTRYEETATEIRRIWEYLLGQQRNGNGSGSDR